MFCSSLFVKSFDTYLTSMCILQFLDFVDIALFLALAQWGDRKLYWERALRKLSVQILVGDRGSWDLFLDIKLCFFGNFFIFACDRVLLHPTETLFWMCTRRLEIRDFFPFCVHISLTWVQEGNCATSIKNNQKYTVLSGNWRLAT